ncbi:hypothetical protein D3C81_2000160 [compost metagenome]
MVRFLEAKDVYYLVLAGLAAITSAGENVLAELIPSTVKEKPLNCPLGLKVTVPPVIAPFVLGKTRFESKYPACTKSLELSASASLTVIVRSVKSPSVLVI